MNGDKALLAAYTTIKPIKIKTITTGNNQYFLLISKYLNKSFIN